MHVQGSRDLCFDSWKILEVYFHLTFDDFDVFSGLLSCCIVEMKIHVGAMLKT